MFVNILVAIDVSTYAAKGLDCAILLAQCFLARIIIVHVIPAIDAISAKLVPSRSKHVNDLRADIEEGNNILAEGEKIVKIAGISVTKILKYGNAADKILETAEEIQANLIVVGERGLGSVARFPIGSIACNVN